MNQQLTLLTVELGRPVEDHLLISMAPGRHAHDIRHKIAHKSR
jgi:hypothetical protein